MTIVKEQIEKNLVNGITLNEEEKYRINRLTEKENKKGFEVAFCGHFSAGKSTILNTLLGAEVLPTSPIPTSANIISIKNGTLGLAVHNQDGSSKEWSGEIPWEKVREWGMDGNKITGMTITAPLSFLGEHSSILDTPGVDSTDDSHQAVTVDQLYTTDAIVYVMDYNHVQSETNLYFLKQLSEEKKPIYIVINQIDKHNEEEIPISMFKRSMEEVFKRWNIQYLALYFTTMKHPSHALNQFTQFEQDMKGLLFNSEKIIPLSLNRLEEGILQAVKSRLNEEKEERVDEIVESMKEKGYSEEQLERQHELKEKLEKIIGFEKDIDSQYEKEIGGLYKNVTLFPFTTTDLARSWIESVQPGFKVGLFFTKKKTEEEQEKRLALLVADLQDKVKGQLLFHIHRYFQKIDRTKVYNVEELEAKINQLDYTVTAELLKKHVKADHASRDYVFTFTAEITAIIVKELRQKTREITELEKEGLKPYLIKEAAVIQDELEKLSEIESFVQQIESTKHTYDTAIDKVKEQLLVFDNKQLLETTMKQLMELPYPNEEGTGFYNVQLPEESVIDTSWELENKEQKITDFSEEDTQKWLSNVKDLLTNYSDKKLLGYEREQLLQRIERYKNQTFIISLFGAFSAGKSSFANALIGENVLPVSPNPTTATINTVEFPRDGYSHATALVYVKKEKDLDQEIRAVSEQIDEKLTLSNIQKWQPKMKQYVSSWQKTYAEYLETIKASLASTDWKIGSEFVVSQEELQDLIAQESKACLIEKVNIFYDCPITRQGIILVDTPGVNSIHGRHTNVAFQQLRQSDAIFYLTYYNHAFSKADQYFLQQMAKVNESFSHDKLYFVINAADLASSERELNGVRKHVYDQLKANGIASPRLHHLSSKQGLQAKLENKQEPTDFSKFEKAFYDYTILELKELSANMIQDQLKQYFEKMKDSLAFINEEKDMQQQKHEQLKTNIKEEKVKLARETFDYVYRDIVQEKEQLTLYLRERMIYVLNDYFSSAINVAVLTGDNKKTLHLQLDGAIKEWKGLGEYFLQQELEATLIRLEQKIKDRSLQWLQEMMTSLKRKFPHLYFSNEVTDVSFNGEVGHIQLDISGEKYTTFLKSKKEFFEQGMVKELKEVLVTDGSKASSTVIEKVSAGLNDTLKQCLQNVESSLKTRIIESLDQELARFESLFDEKEKQSLEQELNEMSKYVI